MGKPLLFAAFGSKPDAPPVRLSAGQLPDRLYAIGDVHGCLDQLRALEARIVADAADSDGEKWIVMLGDYIDRGPASAQVLDHIMAPPPAGFRRVCLRGNHEQALVDSFDDAGALDRWLEYGGVETMASYGMSGSKLDDLRRGRPKARQQLLQAHIPEEHIELLRELPSAFSVPGYIFVHAGLRPGVALEDQTARDLLWIRRDFLDADHDFGAVVVHGHTPVPEPYVSAHRIDIDTGCFMTGRLTALRVDAEGARVL
jgi:serine/threonine protein phosphatase 1